MSELFLGLLNMSIAASWIAAAVIVLRLLLKKAPKWTMGIFWGILALRLVCPFTIESVMSLLPSKKPIPTEILTSHTPSIDSGIRIVNEVVNPVLSESLAPDMTAGVNPMQLLTEILSVVWLIGAILMVVYAMISYLRVRRQVAEAIRYRDNIWQCDTIGTPFILGILRPKIYLPISLDGIAANYVISHEKAHLRRLDHIWKPLGFLLLSVYWFNPILWVAYILLCRDIELACDEKVMKELGEGAKKEYSNALIGCAAPRKMITACPLAFGETGVKARVKNVLNYKKPAFWIIIVSLLLCTVLAVCFLTSPKDRDSFVPTDAYVHYNPNGLDQAGLTLNRESNRFSFMPSGLLSGYIGTGKYKEADGKLICKTDDGLQTYTFRYEEDTLVFIASESSEMPKYRYKNTDSVPTMSVSNGAVFHRSAVPDDAMERPLIPVHEKDAKEIDQKPASRIKYAFYDWAKEHGPFVRSDPPSDDETPNEYYIPAYYGSFEGCEVFRMAGASIGYNMTFDQSVRIGQYVISSLDGWPVYVYGNGVFYTIREAYDEKLLSKNAVYAVGCAVDPTFMDRYPTPDMLSTIPKHENDARGIDVEVASEIKYAYYDMLKKTMQLSGTGIEAPSDIHIVGYYGKYNGLEFVRIDQRASSIYKVQEERAAGYTIRFPDSVPVFAYQNGRFVMLMDGYNGGYISRDTVYAVGCAADPTFKDRYPTSPDSVSVPIHRSDTMEIDPNVAWSIKKAYFEMLEKNPRYNPLDGATEPKGLWISKYYGCFDGLYVVCIDGDGIPKSMLLRRVNLAGIVITFPSDQPVYAYKDGMLCTVEEAYEKGLLTDSGVNLLARAVNGPLPEERKLVRLHIDIATKKESAEIEERLKTNCRDRADIFVKAILTCGEGRDVPYLITGSERTLNASGHIQTEDGYQAFGWSYIDIAKYADYYPTLTATASDTLNLYINDVKYQYAVKNDAGRLTNGIKLFRLDTKEEVGTFESIADMADLERGKYYAGVEFNCRGDDICDPFDISFVDFERGTYSGFFILELK